VDQGHGRALFQHAGGFAAGIALDFAAGWIGRAPGDAGKFQGERIGYSDVSRDVLEEHGILRRDFIELLTMGEFLVGPQRVIPAESCDPLTGLVLRDGFAKAALQLGDGGRTVEAHREHVRTGAAEVNVGVVEARHDKFFAELDGFGVFGVLRGDRLAAQRARNSNADATSSRW